MPRLLDPGEITSALIELPAVNRDRTGALAVTVRAPTFPAAVQLVDLVATEAEAMDHHPDINLRWRTVTFTFSTHSAGGVTVLDVELARRVLAAATSVGAEPGRHPERVEIALDCTDVDAVRPFWAVGLGYTERHSVDGGVELQDPTGRGPVLWFQRMRPPRRGRGRFHLDVYLPTEEVPERLRACLAAGGRLVGEGHAPSWWVLADPEGNELCLCTHDLDPDGKA